MYIKQAQNIVDGVPQTDNKHIFNEENAVLGPKTYPYRISITTCPVYGVHCNDISSSLTLWPYWPCCSVCWFLSYCAIELTGFLH